MSAHTPGPWHIDGPFGIGILSGPMKQAWIVTAHNGSQLVAEVYTAANAALIGTTPDLLVVLKETLEALLDCSAVTRTVSDKKYAAVAKAEAAIARAEGAQ